MRSASLSIDYHAPLSLSTVSLSIRLWGSDSSPIFLLCVLSQSSASIFFSL
ncbi:hypothetical protein RchiOBHm_Chr6g0246141 [Rosa chinensis]|uniref:Uncharacterized protein n=1 Tax=Rosa chinensis TaxID=74649 RepID=A0A2P6PJF6_ROSCH|nr:hypothetical protein RchiOBHm_Chr6g0246141 [Rosa chinensis]